MTNAHDVHQLGNPHGLDPGLDWGAKR